MSGKTKRNLILMPLVIILVLISFVAFKPKNANSNKELVKRVIETAVVYGKAQDIKMHSS